MSRPRVPRRVQRGSASVLVVVLAVVLSVLGLAGAALTGVVMSQRRAASAADLAALAGAAAPAASACAMAARIGLANGAQVRRCVRDGAEVAVEVTVETAPLLGMRWQGVGRARAGPTGVPP